MHDPNMTELYTVSHKKTVIIKSLPLDMTVDHIKEHMEKMTHDEEFELHFWREN